MEIYPAATQVLLMTKMGKDMNKQGVFLVFGFFFYKAERECIL